MKFSVTQSTFGSNDHDLDNNNNKLLLPKLKLNYIYNMNILIQKEVIFTQNN